MGIKGLPQFLSKNASELFITVPLNLFKGEKIAVDTSVYLYRFMSNAIKNNGSWFDMFLKLVMWLRKKNIRPVFVFDGTPPIQKDRTQNKRRATRYKIEQKAIESTELLNLVQDVADSDSVLTKILKKRIETLLTTKKKVIEIDGMPLRKIIYELETAFKKYSSQSIKPVAEDTERIKDLLSALGLPWIQAPGEAEKTCSWLCYNGYVKAVLTTDSDVLVYGAPIFMKDVRDGQEECIIVYHDEVLKRLGLSNKEFIDFCILCGTDYNNNIEGIGIVTAFEKILEHKNLEMITEAGEDTSTLYYEDGRRLFTLPPADPKYKIPFIKELNKAELQLLLFKNNSKIEMDDVIASMYKPEFVIKD